MHSKYEYINDNNLKKKTISQGLEYHLFKTPKFVILDVAISSRLQICWFDMYYKWKLLHETATDVMCIQYSDGSNIQGLYLV